MKRLIFALAVALAWTTADGYGQGKPTLFYVSQKGSDHWSGKLAAPNPTNTDGPFATLERARDAIRMAKSTASFTGSHVLIREGVYRFARTFLLDSTDSGTHDAPIIWSSFESESVRFVGGKVLTGFRPVSDTTLLRRVQSGTRNKLLVTNLSAQGVSDYGTFPNRMNLFFRGQRMEVARFPNSGWLKIADVPQTGARLLHPGDAKVIKDGHPAGRHFGRFLFDGNRPSTWAATGDIWMHGYWVWDWRDGYQRVDRIDTVEHAVIPAEPHHGYGYGRGQRYYFLNVLEELDTPGEWYLDERNGHLYFWPPAPIGDDDVLVSMLNAPMLELRNTSFIEIRGITFEGSRASAIKMQRGSDNLVAGCTIRNIDNDVSVVIDGGERNGLRSCDIYDVGSTGLKIAGGDRTSLTPGANFAINNHIHRYGCITQAFSGAIWVEGVGNVISHNRIHDAPFSGIQFYGNDHTIEYNEIFDLAHESGDVGGVNTGADYSDQGTTIRYNYFHDTHGYGEGGFRAVYLDLPGSNMTIFGNIFCNVDIGVFFNSGRDNTVENNVFVDCHPGVNIYIWPHTSYFHEGGAWKLVEKLRTIRYQEPPYSVHYPKLPSYLDSAVLGMPYGNSVIRNISCGGTWLDLSEELNFTHITVKNNLITDSILLVLTKKWTPNYDPYHIGYAATYRYGDSTMMAVMQKEGNLITAHNPGFVDREKRDFRLTPDSPAWKLGFVRIPIEKIGLIVDGDRKVLP